MYSICQICGRKYTGINCLRCTQQAIMLQDFGEETISHPGDSKGPAILSRTSLGAGLAMLKLVSGETYAIPKPTCRIGQDMSNDIAILEDDAVARYHAQISFDEKEREYVLRDLGTKCGTFLNSDQVHLDAVIFGGDQITIGKYKFYFQTDLDF